MPMKSCYNTSKKIKIEIGLVSEILSGWGFGKNF